MTNNRPVRVPVLRTARLALRGLERADTDAVLRVFADPEQSRFLAADLSDPARCRESVERRLAYDGPGGLGHWVIEHQGHIIGLAHLRPSTVLPAGTAELGYFLHPAHGGRGLATEAAAALVGHGLDVIGLPAVWALVHESNVASRKLVERLGFHDVGGEHHYGGLHRVYLALPSSHGRLHTVELRVPDLARAEASLGWLLTELGWRESQRWSDGVSWRLGSTHTAIRTAGDHPQRNRLALHVGSRERRDELLAAAGRHGWLSDGEKTRKGEPAQLENGDGLKIELVVEGPGITHGG